MTDTVLDRIVGAVHAALAYNANAHEVPVALLWPDEGAQWQPVIDRLGALMPVVSLGDYDPSARRGPGYWLRCVVAGTVDAGIPDGPPVVYLPGISRSALRAVDTCPAELAPIAELQYRSQWFSHPNNRDWSVRALLSHAERGLGLNIADNADTSAALLLALGRLLDERADRLVNQVLDADYFRDLVNPDPVRFLLGWLDDPQGYPKRFDPARWTAFMQQCRANYELDPIKDGELTAARMLAAGKGKWAAAWDVFAAGPERYPGIPDQLRKARPQEQLILGSEVQSAVWPQDNEVAENRLRMSLNDFKDLTPESARKGAAQLDTEHAWRRGTVWAQLDLAPLAFALEQIAVLAEVTAQPLDAANLSALTADYAERGWRADDSALRALTLARSGADRAAVSSAVLATYRWWLDAGARALQSVIGPLANAHTYHPGAQASTQGGTITVFVDGLRLDVAHRMKDRLIGGGLQVELTTSLAALPTVTETAKAAVFPVPEGSLSAGPDLWAARTSSGAKATKLLLQSLATEKGVQCLPPSDLGNPSGTAWTEVGQIDHLGHEPGTPLIDDIDREVEKIVRRVRELLEAGWQRIDIITDHGWILLPGGMEKVELPVATTAKKKGRCARLKDGAIVETPMVPWFWDQDVKIAIAPGVTCFEANKAYEHGGVSPQECIVPRLSVKASTSQPTVGAPEITKVKWLNQLCRIEVVGATQGVVADIRGLPGDAGTSIASKAKETSGAGQVSLLVPDDDQEGERAFVVLVAPDGEILAQREVVVGRNR